MKNRKQNSIINILVSSNVKYLDKVFTMLCSIKRYNKEFRVYFLNQNVPIRKMDSFKRKVKKTIGCEVIELVVQLDTFKGMPVIEHFSIEMYFRLLAQDYLPEGLERIMWVDADVICMKSIERYYNQEFCGKSIIASTDSQYKEESVKKHKKELGLTQEHNYINSGIIIFNLEKIRKTVTQEKVMDVCASVSKVMKYPDQDVLNILYQNEIKYESKYFNYQLIFKDKLKEGEIDKVVFLHYTGAEKPWRIKCINDLSKYYWDVEIEIGNKLKYKYVMLMNKIYGNIKKCYFKVRRWE